MLRPLGLLQVVVLGGLGATNPIREVTSQAERIPSQLVPGFDKGYVYWIGRDGPDTITLYSPDGGLACSFASENRPVHGIAIDADGSIAVSWGSWNSQVGGGIDWRDPSGRMVRTVKTPAYVPMHLAFSEDHSLWSFGAVFNGTTREDAQGMMLRRFLPGGQQAGAYLPRSAFPSGLAPAHASWQSSARVYVTRDRVGLLALSGKDETQAEWVEVDPGGKLLSRWSLNSFGGGRAHMAMTSDGCVYTQRSDGSGELHALDRKTGNWRVVPSAPDAHLEGADGDALVFSSRGLGPIHLLWYNHEQL
jgi:hypothetical protein